MRHSVIVIAASAVLLASCSNGQASPDVIPLPNSYQLKDKNVNMSCFKTIHASSELCRDAGYLKDELLSLGYDLQVSSSASGKGVISLVLDEELGAQEYRLDVKSRSIEVRGGKDGVFYGVMTLLQELRNGGVKYGVIEDAPRYEWRGFMLDEARHFFGVEKVKSLLDYMAYYKLNRFHWHLTDAQGWRIEIKAYPKLTEIGGIGTHSDPYTPAQYYTQDQIREIVSYAKARHIEIIPEIDMPGHASAANRAYPVYNGGGTPQFEDFTFNVGKEGTYKYLTAILREVAGLFPYDYIHIGGDEVFYGSEAWGKDKYVQAMMRREGLKTIKDAEGYFLHRMTDSLRVLGKIEIAWDDVLDFDPDTRQTVICWWRHDRPASLRKSLANGYTTIMCPRKPLYYDFVQDSTHTCGRRWDGFCPLEDVYAFPDAWYEGWELTESDMSGVLGIQANLWTELVHNTDRFDFMIFPRLCALAEVAWTMPDVKDYGSFTQRMEYEYAHFDADGLYYFDARDRSRHAEPEGPVIKKKDRVRKMDYKD